jgi:hypothetical protein
LRDWWWWWWWWWSVGVLRARRALVKAPLAKSRRGTHQCGGWARRPRARRAAPCRSWRPAWFANSPGERRMEGEGVCTRARC